MRNIHEIASAGAGLSARTTVGAPVLHDRVLIRGLTRGGRAFRPSDWAERLAGVMAQFRPSAMTAACGSPIAYSPWCMPSVHDGVKCVIVDRALREHEPMAWDFVIGFARDNELQVIPASAN
jgi:hypothetical protein